MKKFAVLLIMIFVSLGINAQDKFETEAEKWVAEMNEVITLSEAQQKQIYDIELNKNIKKAEIRKENAGNQPVIKEKVTALNKEAYAAMREVVGAEKMKMWSEYRKEQLAKKQLEVLALEKVLKQDYESS